MKSCFFLVALISACTSRPLMAQAPPVTFDFVGHVQTWVVPNGLTSVVVDARGARGGGNGSIAGAQGGKGGRVQTTLAVVPGETLVINVGGRGGDLIGPNTAGPGGFNGGGIGGIDNVDFNAPAGGGGGASDVRQGGTDLTHRVVVAGGGGGAECCTDANGGDGGGLTGMAGATSGGGSAPGGGGTQFSGGTGGAGCNGTGSDGSLDQGGFGGNGNRAGGGGGGGYFGGGGGGGCLFGSGGGGGSSFSAGTNTTHTPGFQAGDGQVTITLPVAQTLGEKAAARARSLLNHPYFEGAKGYDMATKNTNPPFPYVSVDSASSGTSSISGGYLHCTTAGCPPKISLDTTKPGIDCSGLVFWSYNTAAGALQTDTADNPLPSRTVQEGTGGQFNAKTSTHVDLTNLKPGDLLFFNYDPGAGVAVSHVAMYVGPTSDFPEGEVVEAYLPNAVLRGNHGIISSSCDIKAGCKRAQEDPITHESLDCTKIPRPNNCFVDYRTLNLPKKFAFVAATQSPIGLIVTDPDGYTITPDTTILTAREVLHEIPDQLYYGTNDKGDDEVIGLTLKSGNYLIKPVPKPDALPGDTYGLTVTVESGTLTLAQNVPISDIPSSGYGVVSTGSTIAVFIPVAIDIKPGDTPNSINPKSNGSIPVAVLSNNTFDAVAQIDQTSLTFGHSGDEASLASCHSEDVNVDGLRDLVCHFYTQSTGFLSGDTVGVLKGKSLDGTPVRGTDSVSIVPK